MVSPTASGYCQEGLYGNKLFKSSHFLTNETSWMGSMWLAEGTALIKALPWRTPAQVTLSLGLHLNAIYKCFPLRDLNEPQLKIKSLVPWPTKGNQLFFWWIFSSSQLHVQLLRHIKGVLKNAITNSINVVMNYHILSLGDPEAHKW